MEHYLEVDGVMKGEAGAMKEGIVNILRSGSLFAPGEDKNTVVAVERFHFETFFPLFDTERYVFAVGLRNVGSSSITSLTIEWGTKYLYDYRHVGAYINNALQSICTQMGIEDKPIFFFDASSSCFGVVSTDAFRESYQLFVSEDIHHCLNTFAYGDDAEDGGWWRLELEQDAELQPIQTLEFLSPVSRILVDTTLPIVKGMLPNVQRLEDRSTTQDNNQYIVQVSFAVGDQSTHRWSNLLPGSQLDSFSFSFFWLDWAGNLMPIVIPPQGTLDVKARFKTIRPLA